MRVAVLIMVMVSIATASGESARRIDSILTKARDVRNEGVKGFIIQQKQQELIPPDELFGELDRVPGDMESSIDSSGAEGHGGGSAGNSESSVGGMSGIAGIRSTATSRLGAGGGSSASIRTPSRFPTRSHQSFVSFDRYSGDREQSLREITELKIQVDRLATAVSYMVDNSTDQKKMIELLTKFFEVLTPLLVAIGGLFGWSKVRKRKNGKSQVQNEVRA